MEVNDLKCKEAYLVMFSFLEEYYFRTNDAGIAALLSDLSLLPDGAPADPAVVEDWNSAVGKVNASLVSAELSLEK